MLMFFVVFSIFIKIAFLKVYRVQDSNVQNDAHEIFFTDTSNNFVPIVSGFSSH